MENNQPDIIAPQSTSFNMSQQVPPVMPPVKKQNKIIFIIFGIVFLIIIVSIIVVISSSKKMTSVVTPSPTPTPLISETPTPIASPTANPFVIELTLEKGKVVEIPNSELKIIYKGQSAPNPQCFDCITTTDMVVIKQNVEQNLNYFCGGIAGKCTDKLTAYGYEFTLLKASEELSTVKIQKQ